MYAYVEIETELKILNPSPEQIADEYNRFSDAFKPKPINEMPKKEFDAYIENQLLGNGKNGEEYYKMSPAQQECAQTIKRALKRLEAKENKNDTGGYIG